VITRDPASAQPGLELGEDSLGDFVHPLLILLDAEGVIAAASDQDHGLAHTAKALGVPAEIDGEGDFPGSQVGEREIARLGATAAR
jgi:hypothetical protein